MDGRRWRDPRWGRVYRQVVFYDAFSAIKLRNYKNISKLRIILLLSQRFIRHVWKRLCVMPYNGAIRIITAVIRSGVIA